MEVQEIHRGRLIDHLHLVVRDLDASKKFYKSIFEALKIPWGGDGEDFFWVDELFVSTQKSVAAQGELTGRSHFAFQALDEKMVEAFHKAGIEGGGKDNGKPGKRAYHPGYYAAFIIDPDGNNVEAVFHGRANRSSPSIKITF